jgi:hypothetical protein
MNVCVARAHLWASPASWGRYTFSVIVLVDMLGCSSLNRESLSVVEQPISSERISNLDRKKSTVALPIDAPRVIAVSEYLHYVRVAAKVSVCRDELHRLNPVRHDQATPFLDGAAGQRTAELTAKFQNGLRAILDAPDFRLGEEAASYRGKRRILEAWLSDMFAPGGHGESPRGVGEQEAKNEPHLSDILEAAECFSDRVLAVLILEGVRRGRPFTINKPVSVDGSE